MTPIRIAIAGLGQYAETNYLGYLLQKEEIILSGICDLPSKKQYFNDKLPGVPFFDSYDRLLQSLEFDALIISTPHNFHYSYALKGLQNGKHVFIDKQLALTRSEAEKLILTNRTNKSVLLTGIPKRYSNITKTIKGLIDSDQLGDLLSLDFVYYRPYYEHFSSSWRNTHEGRGGVIFDAGFQIIDALLDIVKQPVKSIICQVSKRGFKVETTAKIGVKFKDSPAIAGINLALHPPNGIIFESIVIQGKKATLLFKRIKSSGVEAKREFYLIGDGEIRMLNATEKTDIDIEPISHFFSLIQAGRRNFDFLARDLRTIEFIERVYGSLEAKT